MIFRIYCEQSKQPQPKCWGCWKYTCACKGSLKLFYVGFAPNQKSPLRTLWVRISWPKSGTMQRYIWSLDAKFHMGVVWLLSTPGIKKWWFQKHLKPSRRGHMRFAMLHVSPQPRPSHAQTWPRTCQKSFGQKVGPGKVFFLMSVASRNSGRKGKKLKRRRERLVGPLVGPQPEKYYD